MARVLENTYMQRNQLGFEGDRYIGEEIKSLVDRHNVSQIVETGTYYGYTTLKLVELCDTITIEIQQKYYAEAQKTFAEHKGLHKIDSVHDDSVKALTRICPTLDKRKVLFYLDAHWLNHCPLIDELKVIAQNEMMPVICIHDFKVPNRPDLGYDTYNGQAFEFDWIENAIINIYGQGGFAYHYNDKSEGANRGIVYLYPSN